MFAFVRCHFLLFYFCVPSVYTPREFQRLTFCVLVTPSCYPQRRNEWSGRPNITAKTVRHSCPAAQEQPCVHLNEPSVYLSVWLDYFLHLLTQLLARLYVRLEFLLRRSTQLPLHWVCQSITAVGCDAVVIVCAWCLLPVFKRGFWHLGLARPRVSDERDD